MSRKRRQTEAALRLREEEIQDLRNQIAAIAAGIHPILRERIENVTSRNFFNMDTDPPRPEGRVKARSTVYPEKFNVISDRFDVVQERAEFTQEEKRRAYAALYDIAELVARMDALHSGLGQRVLRDAAMAVQRTLE